MSLGVASAVAPADAQHVPAQEAADTDTVEMGVVADTVAAGTVGDAVEQMALGRVLGMDYRDVEDQDLVLAGRFHLEVVPWMGLVGRSSTVLICFSFLQYCMILFYSNHMQFIYRWHTMTQISFAGTMM